MEEPASTSPCEQEILKETRANNKKAAAGIALAATADKSRWAARI
jgi:hypothetical protein